MGNPLANVNQESLQSASSAASNGATEITGIVRGMLNELDATEAQWAGAAKTSFVTVRSEVETQLNRLVDGLEDLAQGLTSAGAQFGDSDQQASMDIAKALDA